MLRQILRTAEEFSNSHQWVRKDSQRVNHQQSFFLGPSSFYFQTSRLKTDQQLRLLLLDERRSERFLAAGKAH